MTDKQLTLDALYDRIYAVSDDFKSYKDAVAGFDGSPPGYKYIFAIDYVDADVRNGGIDQLHRNSTWHLILDAVEGAQTFGFTELAANLKEILYYYHRNGRSKMKKRIPSGYFDSLPDGWEKDLDTLENEYYECFARLGTDDTRDLWNQVIQQHSDIMQ